MIDHWARILEALEIEGRVARVFVAGVRGSAPREVGAAMVVRRDLGFRGSIGGGALEWHGLKLADAALCDGRPGLTTRDVALGPELGQCCGGRVTLGIEVFDRDDLPAVRALAEAERRGAFTTAAQVGEGRLARVLVADGATLPPGLSRDGRLVERFGDDRRPLLLFGAGHVGRALVLALAPLPFRVDWIDTRVDAFPAATPANVTCRRLADPTAAVAAAPAGSFVLAMTHDHAQDLAIAAATLDRPGLPWLGVIGSATKRARFLGKLREMGRADDAIRRMVMPVGAGGPKSRHPAAIAASVAVELLVADEQVRNGAGLASTVSSWSSGVGA